MKNLEPLTSRRKDGFLRVLVSIVADGHDQVVHPRLSVSDPNPDVRSGVGDDLDVGDI